MLLSKKIHFNGSHANSGPTKHLKNVKHLALLSLVAIQLFFGQLQATQSNSHDQNQEERHILMPKPNQPAKIQLAILLDTSGSMDGLIDQTRNQLWQVVNEFSTAKNKGITPILEVALFEYGNDGNAKDSGYVRMLNNFTRELDKVSEGLFSLKTNGGSEYCGFAIKTAIHSLGWTHNQQDIRTIFIAGNEPFTQGPVNYREALRLANQHGIAVNTIHAGDHQVGIETGWQNGALLAGGDYMSIDANQIAVHVVAPQDKRIAELNRELNQTYVPYGKKGQTKHNRQMEQDNESNKISAGLLAKRAKSKSSSFYNNSNWDLVDAFEDGQIKTDDISKIDKETLPTEIRALSESELETYIIGKSNDRKKIKEEILTLSHSRDNYVAEEKKKMTDAAPSMSDALTKAIKKQAEAKNYTFEK